LLSALRGAVPFVSPTLFHNSVHNTPAGYWSIAADSRSATTSICAGSFTFAAGLLKAATIATLEGENVLFVGYDAPFPDPLARLSPFPGPLAVALILGPPSQRKHVSRFSLSLAKAGEGATSTVRTKSLGLLFEANPIGQCLPLFESIATQSADTVTLDYCDSMSLMIKVGQRGPLQD
jgi:hypothetical protein